jgi:murein DD-endopeptidase MepM/ murein hydrolase activator NlpD
MAMPQFGKKTLRIRIRRPKTAIRSFFRFIPVLVFLAAAVLSGAFLIRSAKRPAVLPDSWPSIPEVVSAAPLLREHRETIGRDRTLAAILQDQGFSAADVHRIREASRPAYDLSRIRTGHEFRLFFSEDDWDSLEYDIDGNTYLVVTNAADDISAEIREFPFENHLAVVWGEIRDSLILAVNRAGERDILALSLAEDIFGWDIDFHTDIQPGDAFRILFEKRFLEGDFAGYGNILAAEFTNRGKTFRAFRFTDPETGKADYYDADGNSLKREFLRTPIKFARITSRFSHSRLHPIRKIYRPHYGVDYAAPVGTPVQATGDGTVAFAGWSGAAGRMIRIRHKNGYETSYLHLRGYAKGIRQGVRVQAGQTIGYVGSSGESTGPHLDYRISQYGRFINPLSSRFEPAAPLREELRAAFREEAARRLYALNIPAPAIFSAGSVSSF